EMNVVNLAQPGECAVDQNVERRVRRGRSVFAAERAQRAGFLGAGGGDPGRDGVDDTQLEGGAKRLGDAAADALGHIGAELLERRHDGLSRSLPARLSSR